MGMVLRLGQEVEMARLLMLPVLEREQEVGLIREQAGEREQDQMVKELERVLVKLIHLVRSLVVIARSQNIQRQPLSLVQKGAFG
jgi:hypothetical protein